MKLHIFAKISVPEKLSSSVNFFCLNEKIEKV